MPYKEAFPVAPVDSSQSDLDQLGPKVVSALLLFIGHGSRFCGLPLTFLKDGKREGGQTQELLLIIAHSGVPPAVRRDESMMSSMG